MDEQAKKNAFRITRVYTRVGDRGMTRLAGGRQVPKSHPRLSAYGTLDELQVAIGAARDALRQVGLANPAHEWLLLDYLGRHLAYIQNMLFTLSGDLATPIEDRHPQQALPDPSEVVYLEKLIDTLNGELPPLEDFLLPGGHPAATALHFCRVVCRRAEREMEALAATEPIGQWDRPIVNRLSDVFFVMARRVMLELERAGIAHNEQIWQKNITPPPL